MRGGLGPRRQGARRQHQHVELGPELAHVLGRQRAGPADARREPQVGREPLQPLPVGTVAHHRQVPAVAAVLGQRLEQSIDSLLRHQAADAADCHTLVEHVLRLRGHVNTELGDRGDGQVGHDASQQRRGGAAPRDRARDPAQHAAAPPTCQPRQRQLHVLMGEQNRGQTQVAGGSHRLLGRRCGRFFFYLHQVGSLVAQQRVQRAAAELERVGLAVVARRDGEDLDPVLALPRDLDRRAEHRVAPALRDADGDVDATRGERAQLAAVRSGEVGVRDDQDAVHENQMPSAECGMRNVSERSVRPATPVWPFRIPHSTFRILFGPLAQMVRAADS